MSDFSTTGGESANLQQAIEKLDISIEQPTVERIQAYCELLWEWNTKINLTRHTNYDVFVRRDLLDSLHLAELLQQEEDVLDIGTGGGVPGLLIALLRPDLNISVCDSVEKKSRVAQDIVDKLDLPVAVYPSRAQDVLEDLRFHSCVTRAVGSLAKLLGWLQDHWLSFDRLLAIKGPRWTEERGEARHRGLMANLELRRVDAYEMPGTDSESVILEIQRKKDQ